MGGFVKLILGLMILFGVLFWATNNPKSAENIVDNVEQVYDKTAEVVKENLFDKDGE